VKFIKRQRRKKTGHRKVSHVNACRLEAGATIRQGLMDGVEHCGSSGCAREVGMYENGERYAAKEARS